MGVGEGVRAVSWRSGFQYLKVWLFRWVLLQLVVGHVTPVYQIVSSLGHVAMLLFLLRFLQLTGSIKMGMTKCIYPHFG